MNGSHPLHPLDSHVKPVIGAGELLLKVPERVERADLRSLEGERIRARKIRPRLDRASAQVAARRLARSGFWVIIYGDADHPEVRGILGWAGGKGIATLDDKFGHRFSCILHKKNFFF